MDYGYITRIIDLTEFGDRLLIFAKYDALNAEILHNPYLDAVREGVGM